MRGCCFTGYRPEKFPFPCDDGNIEYMRFESRLTTEIARAVSDGFDTFYCGGAKGFDLLAAELLLLMRQKNSFRLIMVLPYRAQDSAFSPRWKALYGKVLSSADEILYLSDTYHPQCFAERNEYMVDRSERVIAFCDGKSGGSQNTIRYARRMNKEIINIWELMKENINYTIFELLDGDEKTDS